MKPRAAVAVRGLIAVAIGLSIPYLELAWKCRADRAVSEACVWARAYLPLTRWLELALVAPVVFVLLTLLARRGRASDA
jgi:hypothetical protein